MNSALQRARAAARAGLPASASRLNCGSWTASGSAKIARAVRRRHRRRGDADTLVSMLTEDATWCMLPTRPSTRDIGRYATGWSVTR